MQTRRKRLYAFLLSACMVGYAWLTYCLKNGHSEAFAGCLFKRITGIPCPSCGSTRSILELASGHFQEAFLLNPLGYLLAPILVITPVWIVFDLLQKKNSLLIIYQRIEQLVRKPQFAIPLSALILIIWGWNISKGI
jgi:hypothetical protein